jgi:hypothetical protein
MKSTPIGSVRHLVMLALLVTLAIPQITVASSKLSTADRQDILDLISLYSQSYDSKDLKTWLTLFTEDCLWAWYSGPEKKKSVYLEGKTAIKNFYEPRIADMTEKGIQSRHYQTNTLFGLYGGNTVTARTYIMIIWQQADEEMPKIVMTGYYQDEMVKTGTGWKFKKRVVYVDHR